MNQILLRLRSFTYVALALLLTSSIALSQTITLDGRTAGRTFDGLGAVSGGGNTSRLLPDYPEAQRNQILDYMFKPQFGASLNVLKVEVGGDVNSTEGSEPSHMHTRNDENYQRGFEWWLMKEARARNPRLVLDCLAWGAPGWVGNGEFWSKDMMDYYIRFIKGARRYHGLDISSVGGRNERGYNANWFKEFRKALNGNGLSSVKLVASDDWGPPWLNIANDALKDESLKNAIDVFAGHVTWSENPAVASEAILKLGKPLWDTELHNYKPGFDAEISLINAFNTNYLKTKITRNLVWNLIWSYYPVSSYPDVGMMRANAPWSGHYEVLPVLWGYAHVNQFARLGWRFLDGNGSGTLPAGGTYTSLAAPKGGDYSIIIETQGATAAQIFQFRVAGGLSTKTVHVWRSGADAQFVQLEDLKPTNGTYTLTLNPNSIYSITTTTGQRKGSFPASPPQTPFPFPYADDYQRYALNAQAQYHYDYEGAFEIARKTKGEGKCLRQAATKSASGWGGSYLPLTFLGSSDWKDYSASADVFIENAGAVSIHGRIGNIPGDNREDPPGYTFRVQDTGAWELKSFKTVIAKGNAPFSANDWHNLRLNFRGSNLTAFIDERPVCAMEDSTFASGLVGLGSGWNFAQFGNLKIQNK